MENKVFTDEEKNLLKSMIRKHANERKIEIDDECAISRFEYVLRNTRPNIANRFLNNVEYTCATSNPPKDKYYQLAYFAVKMDEWVKLNFVFDVTKHGNIIFMPRHPDKNNKYIFTSASDKVWTRDDFNDFNSSFTEDEREDN